jgi:hypothetical protein
MYHRDGSLGKGSRRGPWREGGARKARRPEWQKRASHAVEAIDSITEPVASLWYLGDHRKNPSERIYVLDQRMAKAGIPYFAEYGNRWSFRVTVSAKYRTRANAIIESLWSTS